MSIKFDILTVMYIVNQALLLDFDNILVRNILFPAFELLFMGTPVFYGVFLDHKARFVLLIDGSTE